MAFGRFAKCVRARSFVPYRYVFTRHEHSRYPLTYHIVSRHTLTAISVATYQDCTSNKHVARDALPYKYTTCIDCNQTTTRMRIPNCHQQQPYGAFCSFLAFVARCNGGLNRLSEKHCKLGKTRRLGRDQDRWGTRVLVLALGGFEPDRNTRLFVPVSGVCGTEHNSSRRRSTLPFKPPLRNGSHNRTLSDRRGVDLIVLP